MQLLARTLLTWMKLDNRGVYDMGCYAHMKGSKNSRILLYFYCFFELQHFIDVLMCLNFDSYSNDFIFCCVCWFSLKYTEKWHPDSFWIHPDS